MSVFSKIDYCFIKAVYRMPQHTHVSCFRNINAIRIKNENGKTRALCGINLSCCIRTLAFTIYIQIHTHTAYKTQPGLGLNDFECVLGGNPVKYNEFCEWDFT
jgi:hypothetical protein